MTLYLEMQMTSDCSSTTSRQCFGTSPTTALIISFSRRTAIGVSSALKEYESNPPVRQKYEWGATYHNYVCREITDRYLLKPERTPLEAIVWETPKSSRVFSTLFRSRLHGWCP